MTRTLLVGFGIIVAMLCLVLATEGWGLGRNDAGQPSWPMLLEDESDRAAYQLRGRWLASGGVPYLDEYSEYPQLTTWTMALPYLVMDHGVERGEPFGSEARLAAVFESAGLGSDALERCLKDLRNRPFDAATVDLPGSAASQWTARLAAVDPDLDRAAVQASVADAWRARRAWRDEIAANRKSYGNLHQVLMAVLLAALLSVTTANLRSLGQRPEWALLLLLPPGLYYAFSRFDLLVTLLVALAVAARLRDRARTAGVLLGLAIMAKWYPVVLVPLFLSHGFHRARHKAALGGSPLTWRTALMPEVIVPGLCTTSVVGAVLGVTWFWGDGGLAAVRVLFDYHGQVRVNNVSALLTALVDSRQLGWFSDDALPRLKSVFSVAQLLPGFVLALLPLRRRDSWLLACLAATLSAVVFSKFFSPQWVVWGTPLMLLLASRQRLLLAGALLLETLAYLQLPVIHYNAQLSGDFDLFWMVNRVRMAVLCGFLVWVLVLAIRDALRAQTAEDGAPPSLQGPT